MDKKRKNPETLFNKVFADIKDMFNINIPAFCRFSSNDDNSYIQKIGHYTVWGRPKAEERKSFIMDFVDYLVEECEISSSDIKEHSADLENILIVVNRASGARGMKFINLEYKVSFIGLLLNRAYELSDPAPIASLEYPIQHFEKKKLNGSPYFFGRYDLVATIFDIISGTSKDEEDSVYLQGVGGIGKTEVVRAIVKEISNTPSADLKNPITDIIWIDLNDGKDGDGISHGDDIRQKVYLALYPDADIDKVDWVKEYPICLDILKSKGARLLIVIDNIETRDDDLRAFCNDLEVTRFILAGRPYSLDLPKKKFTKKVVKPLEPDNCLELFKKWYFDGAATDGQGLSQEDENDVKKIIELADCHTVTIELFAKLIKKQDFYNTQGVQKTPIRIFLETLRACGFNLKFPDEDGTLQDEEPVSAEHQLMKKERRIIEQLSMLFSTLKITNTSERELLMKISTIPNLTFAFGEVKKWFSLKYKDRGLLDKLYEDGWLQCNDGPVTTYSMHSVIAAAIRHENKEILHKTCRKFIDAMTKSLKTRYLKESQKLLIQFSWSVADVFGDEITEKDDEFFKALITLYRKIHLEYKANHLYEKLINSPRYSIN